MGTKQFSLIVNEKAKFGSKTYPILYVSKWKWSPLKLLIFFFPFVFDGRKKFFLNLVEGGFFLEEGGKREVLRRYTHSFWLEIIDFTP